MVFDDKRDLYNLIDLMESELGISRDRVESFVKDERVRKYFEATNHRNDVVPIVAKDETVHLIYDEGDIDYPEGNAQLALLVEQCGYRTEEHFVSATAFAEQLRDVPSDHFIVCAISPPEAPLPGTKFDACRYVDSHFSRVIGLGAEFSEVCSFKSSMYERFDKANLPVAPWCLIPDLAALNERSLIKKLLSLGAPVFLKMDNGANSEGACLIQEISQVIPAVERLISTYKNGVIACRFLPGREFTIAVSDKMAYSPIERVFGESEKFSPPGGTKKGEKAVSPYDPMYKSIQALAMNAFIAVGGKSYGRVDIRTDDQGCLNVLEVNNLCSVAPNSYFSLSVEQCGYSRIQIFAEQLAEAKKKAPMTNV